MLQKKSDHCIRPQLEWSLQSFPTLPVCVLLAGIIYLVLFYDYSVRTAARRTVGLSQLTRARVVRRTNYRIEYDKSFEPISGAN